MLYKIRRMLLPAYRMFAGKKDYQSKTQRNGAWNPFHQKRESSKGWKEVIKDGSPYTENFSSWAAEKTFSLMKQVNRLFYDQRKMKNSMIEFSGQINKILLDIEAVMARLGELEKKPKRGRPRKSS